MVCVHVISTYCVNRGCVSSGSGLQGAPLADSLCSDDIVDDASVGSCSEDDISTPAKKRKTKKNIGECMQSGMESLSMGFREMAGAITESAQPSNLERIVTESNKRLEDALEKMLITQQAQLRAAEEQNKNMAQLIAFYASKKD